MSINHDKNNFCFYFRFYFQHFEATKAKKKTVEKTHLRTQIMKPGMIRQLNAHY